MFDIQDKNKMNSEIRSWTVNVFNKLQQQYDVLKITHVERSPSNRASKDSMLSKSRYGSGVIKSIGFQFPRHMVFVHKGVGKGVKSANVGSKGSRTPKEWFNPVIEANIEKLGSIVANRAGDMVVKNLKIR